MSNQLHDPKTFWAHEHKHACQMVDIPEGEHIVILYCAPSGVVVDVDGNHISVDDMRIGLTLGKRFAIITCHIDYV